MNEQLLNALVQAVGVPLLLAVVAGLKKLIGLMAQQKDALSGAKGDIALPILVVVLAAVYQALVAHGSVADTLAVGGSAALLFKVIKGILGLVGIKK